MKQPTIDFKHYPILEASQAIEPLFPIKVLQESRPSGGLSRAKEVELNKNNKLTPSHGQDDGRH
jgi:hypothetical protein